jgi:hypothetical protein
MTRLRRGLATGESFTRFCVLCAVETYTKFWGWNINVFMTRSVFCLVAILFDNINTKFQLPNFQNFFVSNALPR